MATTTNFGWETPDDTDLVKDGAAAIRTALGGVDTSFVDLKGGTTGQVLAKASATDLDFSWVAVDPLTILDAKGDLITATAADTPARLAVGTNGQTLVADSSTATGLKWATAGGGGKVLQVVTATTSTAVTIASTTMTDSGITATITPTSATSRIYVIISVSVTFGSSAVDVYVNGALKRGSTTILDMTGSNFLASDNGVYRRDMNSVTYVDSPATTSATTYKFQGAVSQTASSRQVIFQPASGTSVITLLEIGA